MRKILDKLEKVATNYDRYEYCECGCKGSKAHGDAGVRDFERTLINLKPKDLIEIVKLARKAMFFEEGDKELLGITNRSANEKNRKS